MFDHVLIFQGEIVYLSHLDSKGENTPRLRLALTVFSDFSIATAIATTVYIQEKLVQNP